ncbi:hypothetical protein [Brevibacillus sp. HD3.3A]|uniref:hypothetical protein n=1 Tax=Brevibacillus sp. HD3.3A TaxID=2738979 RepID=UPI00156BBAFD|nr:hypothetical protein [Brevibacillus sp. HD3.3A]UED70696.1 hypothetical protein HP435_08695 [Brevibacillus sp. HD3.3A]
MRKTTKILLFFTFVLILSLVFGCSTYEKWTPDQVINSFKTSSLEAENVKDMEKSDYGMAPMTAKSGKRFYIPSLGENAGGRVLTFESQDDLEKMKQFYVEAGKQSAMFFSWVFVKDNVLVQINGDLPEDKAKLYEAALNNIK